MLLDVDVRGVSLFRGQTIVFSCV